ncbi:MAG: tRNA (adenosine(37)-N6)-threonylcarbamoyltransferase complex transferase subunit TsaD [Alphaproteobacteria bacterium]|nr:tRNA (adenosine(37)-N6)-threonylcarbamoyltransferase complex transferase subunit TsaD [Alphaproteobacteria bacterium]
MIVLGIETSCDETAASVVNDKGHILSNIVLSQLKTHRVYGGVVPEIAAREHLEHIDKVIAAAIEDANITFSDLDGVAATCGPGLIGGVMIGMMSAKAIAGIHNIPFLGINHLEGHVLTARLVDKIKFPFLVLLVSGGHTQLLIAESLGQYRRIGTTLDDAAGECFDKSAKLMGLPYPGGPNIEKTALECLNKDAAIERFPLPSPMKDKKNCDFSFSGLKTAVRLHVDNLPAGDLEYSDIIQLSCALEVKIAEILANKSGRAMDQFIESYGPFKTSPAFVVCGGVSANQTIRQQLQNLALEHDMTFHAPPLSLSGDNGAMIAWAGLEHLKNGQHDPLDFQARPRWPLDPEGSPRHGAGIKA